jgi:uncharacterized protein
VHIEEEVLGHRRVDDVDGSLIPELYFRYLREGDGALLEGVIEHNEQDLILLAALLGTLAQQFEAGGREGDPRDQLGFANVARRAGEPERALAFARAAARAREAEVVTGALELASTLCRRAGDLDAAVEALQQALQTARGDETAVLHLGLAKLYEHRRRDFDRALAHAAHTAPAEGAQAQRKRLARLERKQSAVRSEQARRAAQAQLPVLR